MADSKKEFDIEKYYKNLSRAFKGGSPVFRQRIATKIMPPGQTHSPVGTARAFLKSTTNLYASQMASYGMYSRLARYSDYCIAGTTKIWTIEHGPIEIQKLCEMYPNGEKFHVYSYDHKNKKVVIDEAHHPHPTKIDMTYKVNFDGGGCIIANESHEFMLRDGSYRPVKDLKVNDSLMPLYRGKFLKEKEYTWVDVLNRIGTSNNKKWQPEHRYVVEQTNGRFIEEDEVVHHKNFNPADNTLQNLQLMTEKDHRDYHATLADRNNKAKWLDEDWRKQHSKNHSQFMQDHNPAERTDIAFEKIDEFCKKQIENNENISVEKLLEHFQCSRPAISYKLKKAGFKNFTKYAKTLIPNWKSTGQIRAFDLGKARRSNIEFQDIVDKFEGQPARKLARELNTTAAIVFNRVREKGFKNWTDFVQQTNPHNHRIISIEPYKEMQVYDLTTEIHHNFAAGEEEIWKVNHESSKIMQGFVFISNSEMESNSIIASALDIYSDEICTKDEHGEMIKIFSHDQKIRKILDSFFYQVLNIDFNLWTWARNFLKYGDQFLLVDHHPNHGILQILPMPVNEVEREEGFDQNDPLAYRYRWTTQGNRTLDPWQVIHFRNGGNDSFMPYGCSVIEPVRRTWRQVVLLEDAVMTYRIVRSPERRVFYIDVGGIDPNDVPVFIEKVKGQLKRNQTVDQATGQLDKRHNPMSILDDYYIPVRGDMTSTRIESLPGGQYVGDIDDLNYHRDKLFAGLKIPKSYLGYEGEVNARSTLSQEDINFARTIARLQNIVVAELNKMAIIQLFSAGYRGAELMNFELTMASPSIITEIQRLELWRTRFEVASVAASLEGGFDRKFAYKKLFKLSDEEIEEIEEGRRKDKLFDMELEGIAPPTPPPGEVPPEGEVPPAPEGGLAAGEAPAAGEQPSPEGEPPTPDAEAPITTASRDPNQQRIMPNPVKGKHKKRKFSHGLPSNLMSVFSTKKTALDPRDGLIQNTRVATTPFGEETLTMGQMLNEDIDIADEELSRHQLQSRLLQHEQLLRQLEGARWNSVKTSPPPVGSPVEPIEDKEEQEKEDELWGDAQKQEGE